MNTNIKTKGLSSTLNLFFNEIINRMAFLISTGMLFQIKVHEYDKLFLNMFNLGFGVLKFLFESERKVIVSSLLHPLIWNISVL